MPFKIILLTILGLVFWGCSPNETPKSHISKISHDVTVHRLGPDQAQQFDDEKSQNQLVQDCEERLEKIVCVSEESSLGYDQNCSTQKVTTEILNQLRSLLSEIPHVHRKVLCNLDRIQLQSKIFSLGYATMIHDQNGNVIGNMFGIRTDLLTESKSHYLAWKEQLNFGLSKPDDKTAQVSLVGPQVDLVSNSRYALALYVIVHELSHIIDFMNNATQYDFLNCQISNELSIWTNCPVPPESFNFLSWGPTVTLLSEDENTDWSHSIFPNVKQFWSEKLPTLAEFCFYFCEGITLTPHQIESSYRELNSSDFVSSYASASDMEDFAETSSFWALKDTYIVIKNAKNRVLFDTRSQLKKAQLQKKTKWLQNFYGRDDLVTKMKTD